MDRREALSIVSVLFGGMVAGSSTFLSGCQSHRTEPLHGLLNIDDKLLIDDLGETILPASDSSPGAGELKIGTFVNTIVSDCYSPKEQAIFTEGLKSLRDLCQDRFGKNFSRLNPEAKVSILEILEKESGSHDSQTGDMHYYRMIKQLVIWAYLSSRKVQIEVLGYVPVPGKYEGCRPYRPGDKAIA
jgi:hypothetical protein